MFICFRYADMRMIIGLKISQMWHLLGEHLWKRGRGGWCSASITSVTWYALRSQCAVFVTSRLAATPLMRPPRRYGYFILTWTKAGSVGHFPIERAYLIWPLFGLFHLATPLVRPVNGPLVTGLTGFHYISGQFVDAIFQYWGLNFAKSKQTCR